MNQILVSKKLYVTPGMKKKKKMFKIEFFLCHATLVKTGATVTIFILVIESKIPIFRSLRLPNKREFDLPIFLKSHVELLFHLPRYALLILTSISIFY